MFKERYESFVQLALPTPLVKVLKSMKRLPGRIPEFYEFATLKQKLGGLDTESYKKNGNILFIVRDMGMGGVERINLEIIKGTGRDFFEFHMVSTSPVNHTWHDKFSAYCRTVIRPQREINSIGIWNKYFSEIINKLNIHIVVISNSTIGYHCLPYLKSKFPDVKIMDILQAKEMWGATDKCDWAIPYLDKRICYSNGLKSNLAARYKDSGTANKYTERLEVIYNGVDESKYKPDDNIKGVFKARFGIAGDVRIISFIGRFSVEKRAGLFVDIAKNILKCQPDVELKFVMAGDGKEFDEVRAIIDKCELKDHFVLTGAIDNVVELLADTYLLLVVSQNEGLPLVMCESMLMQVPVISTDVGSIHEVIEDSVNGCLVSPDNDIIGSFLDKTFDFLSGKLNYNKMAESARETIASRYTLGKMLKEYEAAFKGLMPQQLKQSNACSKPAVTG